MGRRIAALCAAAAIAVGVSGCGIRIPSDPDGTLEAVEGGVLHAGVSPNGEWVRVDADGVSGTDVERLRAFAESLDAEVEFTVGSEEALVRGLKDGDLDVVAAGITDATPWTTDAGVTRPYAEATLVDGSPASIVMLVPLGENAFLSRLETFLVEERAR
ncbi:MULTISPECIES: transporter substrate-binding domain-containing protein [Microbacterium]|jgi:ABC-type amino acid transport substrate-binding protein|uniref:transporter substrate-binding domain-containing protein n=1 Tax=Microbacterium TaxID=33882 RepID=UPI001D175ABA|nr:transporter substrate-binding domain-containing protein [Microbacterium testaceum]MCC4248152.1 transporter substrate-binding domain-containing protein [Microbacterium testaceum]